MVLLFFHIQQQKIGNLKLNAFAFRDNIIYCVDETGKIQLHLGVFP
jgi:hypothetical protein